MNRASRLMMRRSQARVGGRLASALKALGIPKFCKYQRGSCLANAGDRFQKFLTAGEGVGALDMVVDRLFQPVDLLVYAFKHRLKRTSDRRIARLINLVVQAVAFLFQALKAAGHFLQVPLLGRSWLPRAWLLPLAEASEDSGVDLIGLRTGKLAFGVGTGALRIDYRNGQVLLVQMSCNWFLVAPGGFEANVHVRGDGLPANPVDKLLEPLFGVGHGGMGSGSLLRANQGDFEGGLAYVNAYRRGGRRNRRGSRIGSSHCEITS